MYRAYYLNNDFEEVTFETTDKREMKEFIMNCTMFSCVMKVMKNGKKKAIKTDIFR